MTEAEWLESEDSEAMLEFIRARGTNRKFRLFAAACRRQIGVVEAGTIDAMFIDILEGVADGILSQEAIDRIKANCWAFFHERVASVNDSFVAGRYHSHLQSELELANAPYAFHTARWTLLRLIDDVEDSTLLTFSAILRDIFGNPFRPITFASAWRTSDVMLLARGIYEERAFDRMPILADALQDAGCNRDDILNHLRDPHATHVRGCWALDLVLGKE